MVHCGWMDCGVGISFDLLLARGIAATRRFSLGLLLRCRIRLRACVRTENIH